MLFRKRCTSVPFRVSPKPSFPKQPPSLSKPLRQPTSQPNSPVGRGGLKLSAALELFSLTAAVKGARAVDVGASTGGFTQVLLEAGAVEVLAVDVGRDQLHESLRRDPRVTSLEQTDWKRLSLDVAPGPFDFFTVDVSFVAARNMLRGLAFRLRPGAQGVVLIKPQFELPDHLVRGGDVSAPGLRRQAVDRFTAKAVGLGFRVNAHADSPVAGSEGTVEILAHVVFDGRSEQLPRPGERRPAVAPPARKGRGGKGAGSNLSSDAKLSWFAVVAPGVEELAAREATRVLPDAAVTAVPGGVELQGPLAVGLRANLHLRLPTRLLLRLGDARAREFGQLRHQVARLPWEQFLPAAAPIRISASASHCRLYHTGGIDENLRAAIADRTGTLPEKAATNSSAPLVLIRGVDDRWTISIDSSGERLHRRGWRTDAHEAPLRETLAAALLELCAWQPSQALVDPMCGAGTLPIEAATAALGLPPGLERTFAFESWPAFEQSARTAWDQLKSATRAARKTTLDAPIVGSDEDGRAIAASQANAARAGVGDVIQFHQRALVDAEPTAPSGLFIANPPYGRRLGSRANLPAMYRQMGAVLRKRFRGWQAAVVVPDARLASAFQVPVVGSHRMFHGGLSVTLIRLAP